MSSTAVLAADFRAIGLSTGIIVLIVFVAMFVRNIRVARPELGSEIELAPNRKPYLDDEELEGPKLDRSLTFALGMLALLAMALPFYWLAEPGRQQGAAVAYKTSFESQGAALYTVGAQCVNCHAAGGVGGQAPYVLQDADGQYLANATWRAPALNNVLIRYSESEVDYVLNYGRPGSPMAAWGSPGGGPLTTQQIDDLVAYIRTLQVQSVDPVVINTVGDIQNPEDPARLTAQATADTQVADIRQEVDRSIQANEFSSVGEAVFNLGLYSGYQGGSLSCGRCHTGGWSLGLPTVLQKGVAGCGGGNPSGIGYNLCNGQTKHRFPDDTWKRADGSWMPDEGLSDNTGTYIEAADRSKVRLDKSSNPVMADGTPYLVLDPGTIVPGTTVDRGGDLASCKFVSKLWQPTSGPAYPIDPNTVFGFDENGVAKDPPKLTAAQITGDVITLGDGRLASQCTIVDMPPRTSDAHYNFIHQGAVAGAGYGRGGQSMAGMMPAFGGLLPPDYIQAVIDYERGL